MRNIVIVMRDPDSSNEFEVFGDPDYVDIVDVDYGRSDLRDPWEFKEWADGHSETAKRLRYDGEIKAGNFLLNLIAEARANFGHDYLGASIPGVLWPWATDGNTDHDWIERDDEAEIYPSDDVAARALGEHLGREVKFGWIKSLGRYAPYIDREETM